MMLLYHEPGVDAGENAKGELWWGVEPGKKCSLHGRDPMCCAGGWMTAAIY